MALFETLTLLDAVIFGILVTLGSLLMHAIAARVIYGSSWFAQRVGKNMQDQLEEFDMAPFVTGVAKQGIVSMFALLEEMATKEPESFNKFVQSFGAPLWAYFKAQIPPKILEMIEGIPEGAPIPSLPPGSPPSPGGGGMDLGMLASVVPKEYQQYLPLLQMFMGGGGGTPGAGTGAGTQAISRGGAISGW